MGNNLQFWRTTALTPMPFHSIFFRRLQYQVDLCEANIEMSHLQISSTENARFTVLNATIQTDKHTYTSHWAVDHARYSVFLWMLGHIENNTAIDYTTEKVTVWGIPLPLFHNENAPLLKVETLVVKTFRSLLKKRKSKEGFFFYTTTTKSTQVSSLQFKLPRKEP